MGSRMIEVKRKQALICSAAVMDRLSEKTRACQSLTKRKGQAKKERSGEDPLSFKKQMSGQKRIRPLHNLCRSVPGKAQTILQSIGNLFGIRDADIQVSQYTIFNAVNPAMHSQLLS